MFAVIIFAAVPNTSSAEDSGFFSGIKRMFDKDPKEFVTIEVKKYTLYCAPSRPLYVSIANDSNESITDVEFLAYAHDERFSRAECAEHFALADRVIESKETYSACFPTLDNLGIHYKGKRVSDDMLDQNSRLSPLEFAQQFGFNSSNNHLRSFIFDQLREHERLTKSLDPKQDYGCRNVSADINWFGKVHNFSVFSGF